MGAPGRCNSAARRPIPITGGVLLTSGILKIDMAGNLNPLGTGTFVPNGTGFLFSTSALTGANALINKVAFGSATNTTTTAANLIIQGSHNIEFGGAVTTDDNSQTLTVNGVNVTFSGATFGLLGNLTSRTFTFTGTGNTVINGAVLDGGVTTVAATTTTLGATTATVTSTTGLVVGQLITGTGVSAGTAITAINTTTDVLTLSLAALASGTNNLNFFGAGSIAKSGTGALTLNGADTYSGTTTLNDGTLFGNVTGTANTLSTGPLVLSGGTLSLARADINSSIQSVSALTLTANTSSHIILNGGTDAASSLALTDAGAFTRGADSQPWWSSRWNSSVFAARIRTSTINVGSAYIGGWATVNTSGGTFFAGKDGSNNIAALASTTKDLVSSWAVGDNVTDDAAGYTGTFTLGMGVNTIRFNDGATNSTVTIGSGYTMNVGNNGILVTSNVGTKTDTITGGALTGNANVQATFTVSGTPTTTVSAATTTVTVSSSTLTVGSTAGLVVGMPVSGTGIPAGTTIASIVNGTQLVLSANATTTSTNATVAFPIAPQSIIFGTSELDVTQNDTSADFTIASDIRQPNRATTAGVPLAIVKTGAGALVLSGNNTYGGTTAINEGTLKIGSTTAIGTFDVGNNIVYSAVNIANKQGATLSLNGFNTNIGNLSGGGLDGGTVAIGGNTLTINQTGSTTYSGALTGSGNLVVNGSVATATLTLNTTANNAFTGAVTISDAIVDLSNGTLLPGQTTANLTGATGFIIQNGGGLLIDNNGSLPVNRISSTAPITLMNTAPSGTAPNVGLGTQTDQAFTLNPRIATVGAVTLAYGENTLRAATATAGANPILNIASLTRQNNSTLVVLANNLDTPLATERGDVVATDPTNIIAGLVGGGSTISGSPNISILPWAVGQAITTNAAGATFLGNTFVTYSTFGGFGNGFRALTTSEYEQWTADPASGTTLNNNVRYSANGVNLSLANTSANQMNALLVENTSTTTALNVNGTGNGLTVQSGAFLFLGSTTPQGITLSNFGDGLTTGIATGTNNEYIFHVMNTAAAGVTISDVLTTPGASLTKDGPGTLVLNGSNSNLTGNIVLNQGLLQIGSTANIGGDNAVFGTPPPGPIIFQGGGIQGNGGFLDLSARTIILNPGGPTTLAGGYNLASPLSGNTIDTGSGQIFYGGVLSGVGGLTKTGTGTLTLSGGVANTNAGVIGVFQGELDLDKTDGTNTFNAIGAGGLSINTSSVAGTGTSGRPRSSC